MRRSMGSNAAKALCLVVFALGWSTFAADRLITTTGKELEGSITESEDNYILTLEGGGRMRLPKSIVKTVDYENDRRAQLEAARTRADLSKDADVASLLALADRLQLESDRQALLKAVFTQRFEAAVANESSLRKLSDWCAEHNMPAEAARCEISAIEADFKSNKLSSETCGERLLDLADDFEPKGLSAEAAEARKAALSLAPDAASVRQRLGYVRDEKTGKWLPPWTIKVVTASLGSGWSGKEGSHDYGIWTLGLSIKGDGAALASVKLVVTANSEQAEVGRIFRETVEKHLADKELLASLAAGTTAENVPAHCRMLDGRTLRLSGGSNGESYPLALIVAPDATSEWFHVGDFKRVVVRKRKAFNPRTGGFSAGGVVQLAFRKLQAPGIIHQFLGDGYDRVTHRLYRIPADAQVESENVLALSVGKKAELDCLFIVPEGLKRASLLFENLAPVPLDFSSPPLAE